MKSDYERNRYKKMYVGVTGLLLLLYLGWNMATRGVSGSLWSSMAWMFLFSVVMYGVSYQSLNQVYNEIERITEIMTDIMEEGEEPPAEEYKEGTVGILYTNFYKMVGVLKESRNRELQEKIFLRDIISDISHQLKTPLSSLMVFVDLLLEDKVENRDKQKQILTEAGNQLNRMEWMVLSMLKLARIEAGAIQFEKQQLHLETVILQAAEGIQFLLKERKQELIMQCDSDLRLVCDGEWLTEAVINLLKNASDYSQQGGRIWVETEQTKVYTRIYVRDEGCGIPERELPNIFKRFYRVHQEVNPNSVGIGLSLTKSIINGMGGTIHVKSEEGKFTCFVITFVR